jgi:hypothetical protein
MPSPCPDATLQMTADASSIVRSQYLIVLTTRSDGKLAESAQNRLKICSKSDTEYNPTIGKESYPSGFPRDFTFARPGRCRRMLVRRSRPRPLGRSGSCIEHPARVRLQNNCNNCTKKRPVRGLDLTSSGVTHWSLGNGL